VTAGPSSRSLSAGRRRDPERGAVAISAYLFMLLMLGFLALSLNTGILMDTRTELQTASDSAALAAAGSLDGTLDGVADARSVAVTYGERHRAFDQTIAIDPTDDVAFGRWHLRAAECKFGDGADCFEPLTPSATNAVRINAVKVDNGRDGRRQEQGASTLTLPFGAFVGNTTSQVRSAAVAIGPGVGQPNCALPLVLAECKIRGDAGQLLCGGDSPQFVFSNANVDAVGFVNMDYPTDNQAPSGTWVANQISSNRMCNQPTVGEAKLQNGNDFGKVIEALRGEDGGQCLIGQPQTMAVTGCEEGNGGGNGGGGNGKAGGDNGNGNSDSSTVFQGVKEIVGFVQVRIVAVTNNQGDVLGCGDEVPTIAGTPQRNSMVLEIMCDAPEGNPGGIKFGTGQNRVRIVR
jgi:hypothetical protein